jgi:hypothetical protein
MALHYPLLFRMAKGFHPGIKFISVDVQRVVGRRDVSMLEYYCYHYHYRNNEPNPYTCGHLSEKAKVDAYSSVLSVKRCCHSHSLA